MTSTILTRLSRRAVLSDGHIFRRLAAWLSEDLGTPVPLTTLALQFYTAACARGMGKQAANDVAKLVGRLAGADFRRGEAGDDRDDEE